MAKYLVNNAKFKPFSYQELIQPILLADAAHKELEDQYTELSTKANVWDKLAGEQPDSKVSTLYRNYANDLRNQANQLAKEGLTPSSRQGLSEMKSRYSTDIIPIEQAYNARAAETAEQLAGKAKGIVYEGDASLSSLDRYLYNPQIRYGMADSQEGYKRVYNSAKALQDQLRNYGNGKRLDYYTKTWLQEHGYKQDEANQAIKDIQEALMSGDNIRGNNILSDILAQEMNTSGVANWSNNAARVDYFNRISPAIYAAVGETKVSPYEDYGRRLSARVAASTPKSTDPIIPSNKYRVNPIPLRSSKEIDSKNKEVQSFIDKGFLIRNSDGGISLSKKGLEALKSPTSFLGAYTDVAHLGLNYTNVPAKIGEIGSIYTKYSRGDYSKSDFSQWYNDNIGGFNEKTGEVSTPNTRLNNYMQSIKEGSYDVYHTTEYDRQVGGSYAKNYLDQMWSAAERKDGEKVLKGVEFDRENGWKEAKSYTKSDLEGYVLTNIRPSRYGSTAILQHPNKNEIIRVEIPRGINPTAEEDLRNATYNAYYFNDILWKGKQPALTSSGEIAIDGNGNIIYTDNPLTYADMVAFKNKKEEALQDISAFDSQIVVSSETDDEQIKPWL